MIEEKKLNLFLEIDSNSEIFEKICHSEDIVYVEGFFWKREYIPCPEDDCLHLHIDSERNITIYDTEGTIMWKSVENPAFETYACLMYIHTVHTDYTFYLDASGLGMLNNSAWESEITSPPVRLNSIDFNILYKEFSFIRVLFTKHIFLNDPSNFIEYKFNFLNKKAFNHRKRDLQ